MASGFTFGTSTPIQAPASGGLFGTPGQTPGVGGITPATTTISLFGNTPAPATATSGFSFANPASSQPQQQTGFSLGGLGATTTTTPQTGFSFGTSNVAPVTTVAPSTQTTALTGTTTLGGLGGVPNSGNARISTLALGTDPSTGWSARNDNRAVQELPVPPEIAALVEELKNQMKNHKTAMMEVSRASDMDIDSVAEQIDEVRMGLSNLTNIIHKQEIQTASLVKEMQELSKDMDLLAQSRDVPAYGQGGTSQLVINFLYELVDKYTHRMIKYKGEIERAEFSLQTIVDAYNLSAADLWTSLAVAKDTVILLAAQIQQLHEEIRNELSVHRNFSQYLLGNTPKPWLASAMSGSSDSQQCVPPLERVMLKPAVAKVSSTNLEVLYSKTYNMIGRVPSESKGFSSPSSEALLRTPSNELRSSSSLANAAYSPSYHPSVMGSYIGPSTPVPNVGLKRSKK